MDEPVEKVKRTSARKLAGDDAVPSTASRPGAGSGRGVRTAPPPPPPPPPPVAPTTSGRRGVSAVKKKKQPMPVKELMIAGGVIVVLLVSALGVYFVKSGKNREVRGHKEVQDKIFEDNMQLAKTALEKAVKAGTLYMVGKTDANFDTASLMAPFKGDDKIFNVIYERSYKDKKADKRDNVKLKDDPEHYTVSTFSNKMKEPAPDTIFNYGFAKGKEQPIVIAKKFVKPNAGEVVYQGGTIIVLVKAEEDDFFRDARKVDLPKTEETKAPVPEVKAPAPDNKTPAAPVPATPAPAAPAAPAPKAPAEKAPAAK